MPEEMRFLGLGVDVETDLHEIILFHSPKYFQPRNIHLTNRFRRHNVIFSGGRRFKEPAILLSSACAGQPLQDNVEPNPPSADS